MLDALGGTAGKDDDRTKGQRYHDALAEAMRRLTAASLLPERAGQPVKAWAHISLADLLLLDGDSALQQEWTERVRARGPPAARPRPRPARPTGRGWTGTPPRRSRATRRWPPSSPATSTWTRSRTWSGSASSWTGSAADGEARPGTTAARAAVEQAVIGKAVDLLSGPGGLASFLRRRQLGARLGGPSLPLDIGYAETVPAGIRNAVLLRDRHCQWAGGCTQPAGACQVHHTRHKAHGGTTSVKDCVLLCPFHHQIVIHRWGWTLVVNPDGTTTRVEQEQDQSPAQPRTTRPRRVTAPACPPGLPPPFTGPPRGGIPPLHPVDRRRWRAYDPITTYETGRSLSPRAMPRSLTNKENQSHD